MLLRMLPLAGGACGFQRSLWVLVGALFLLGAAGCLRTSSGGSPNGDPASLRQYPLDTLPTTTVAVDGKPIRAWIAHELDPKRPNVMQEGLMHVPADQIADDQGMLFIFREERVRGFWMLNTIAPLDIAYARFDGTIVAIRQMAPESLQSYSSIQPAIFALEVKQGTLARLGVEVGDRLDIPTDALRPPSE